MAFTCQPSRKVKEGPTKYNSEPNNLMNKVFFSLGHSVRGHEPVDLVGHGHVDLVGPEHVDLIDLDRDGPEHVDLGTRQKLRRRGKKGKRRRKQQGQQENKRTRPLFEPWNFPSMAFLFCHCHPN